MNLIDPPNAPGHGRLWSHLASDTSYDELHAFARELGRPVVAIQSWEVSGSGAMSGGPGVEVAADPAAAVELALRLAAAGG